VSAWHAGHRASCPHKAAIQADLDAKQSEGAKGNKVRQLCSVALSKTAPVGMDETLPTTIQDSSTHLTVPAAAVPAMPAAVPISTATPSISSTPPVPAAPTSLLAGNTMSGRTSSSRSSVKGYKFEDFEEVPGGRLGQGGFGSVHKVIQKTTGESFAMKVVPKQMIEQHNMSDYLFREVKAQLQLQHPKVLRLFYYFEDADQIHLLLEYASGGSLFHRLQKLGSMQEPEGGPVFAGIVSALGYIHEKGYIHRDLKPENILMCDGGVAKLADFGWCAELIKGAQRQTFCGTMAYLSPEMILNEPHGHEVDIWAAGVLLFEILVGHAPWGSNPQVQTLRKQANAELVMPSKLSLEAQNLISRLLQVKPSERIPLKEVLQHGWVRRNAPQDAMASPGACSLRGSQMEETLPISRPASTAPGARGALHADPAAAVESAKPPKPDAAELTSKAGRQLINEALGLGFSFGDAVPSKDGQHHLIEDFPLLLGGSNPPTQHHHDPRPEHKNDANMIESFPLLLGAGVPTAATAPSFGALIEHKRQVTPPTVSPQLCSRIPSKEISPIVVRVPGALKPPTVVRELPVKEVSPIQTGRTPGVPLASQHAGFKYTKQGDTISPVVVNKVPPPSSGHGPLATAMVPATGSTVDTVSPILSRRAPSVNGLQPAVATYRESAVDPGPSVGSLVGSIRRSRDLTKLVTLDDLDDELDDKNPVERQAFPSFGLQATGQGSYGAGLLGRRGPLDRTVDCRS